MHTLKIESTTYTLKSPERAAQVQALASKKARRKPITAGCGRSYPRFGAVLSTHDYVRDYFAMNAPGVYCGARNQAAALEAGNAALDMFEPLYKHISIPQGQDSVEVEA
jgi:hypothetical protein